MPAELPEKYYLTHAHELFDYVNTACHHLLNDEHKADLNSFKSLSENAQCMWVRLFARKHDFIKFASLSYSEITQPEQAIEELREHGFVSRPRARDWAELAPILTKPELMQILRHADVYYKSSSPKSLLLTCALQELDPAHVDFNLLEKMYIAKRKKASVDYLFFLFFGDLRNRFQKFAMRDLGVLKVRKNAHTQTARYDTKAAALDSFKLQQLHKRFRESPNEVFEHACDYVLDQVDVSQSIEPARDKLLLELGEHISEEQPSKAIDLWRHSNEPKATERRIRLAYKTQDKLELQKELETLKSSERLSASERIFVEDFYARKFDGKRTSIYTDLLRATDRTVKVDEAFINDVEEGVIGQYAQADLAVFTENQLWRVLFAFAFWPILFARQHNEFDRLPPVLRNHRFYEDNQTDIEHCLLATADRTAFVKTCVKLATQHYGCSTGLFRWSSNVMDTLQTFINHAPTNAVANALRRMAKNYHHTKDGYPDIMVIENSVLRFEEIKAPGDVLRPNQLVSIQRLRESGFNVDITQVEWATNPEQIYAVVDIETTGGRKGGHAITEIAVVKVKNGKVISDWSTLVNPERPIPRHITQLTGIDNAMVANAPRFSEIADELKRQLRGAIFVAHNVGFDYGFIKAAYEHLGQSFRMPKYCTVSQSRKTFPGLHSYSLGNLTSAFDIDLQNHHRALADARATAQLLRLIQSENQRRKSSNEGTVKTA